MNHFNNDGTSNTAVGSHSLYRNTTGDQNTAAGKWPCCNNTTGDDNIALGYRAGYNLTTGDHNIDIGNDGVVDDANTIRIGTVGTQTKTYLAGIFQSFTRGIQVVVDSSGHLGTTTSSAKFKDNIEPMGTASEKLLSLQPVTFRYKKELDPKGIPQFGLVAGEVAKVAPELVINNPEGKPYAVRYDAVNAMLLNEFLKTHHQLEQELRRDETEKAAVKELRSTLSQQQHQLAALSRAKERLSQALTLAKPTVRQVVCNAPTDDNTFCSDGAGDNINNGESNSGFGANALHSATDGFYSTALGYGALYKNTTGSNVAAGVIALYNTSSVVYNTAVGNQALFSNTTGRSNTAVGHSALFSNNTGSYNIALGYRAGYSLSTGSYNIYIGNLGAAGDANTIRIGAGGAQTTVRIAGTYGRTVGGDALPVLVASGGLLGTTVSSARFKEDIQPMGNASEAIMSLDPVTFRYQKEFDPDRTLQFGLIAEQVAEVAPALVVPDDAGQPYGIRFQAVNAMLLNEFLKLHG